MADFDNKWNGLEVLAVLFQYEGKVVASKRRVTYACPAYLELDGEVICDGLDVPNMETCYVWHDMSWHPSNPPYDIVRKALSHPASEWTTELYNILDVGLAEQGYHFKRVARRIEGVVRIAMESDMNMDDRQLTMEDVAKRQRHRRKRSE